MRLNVGERLAGSGPPAQPGGYLVTEVIRETPWYGLYAAKKIFYNFDFTTKRIRETDEKESLDVCLRTIQYPYLDDAAYVAIRRALTRAEGRRILGRSRSNLWPEPLDLLEVPNRRDPFAFSRADLEALGPIALDGEAATSSLLTEPILVFARPGGQVLWEWQQKVLPVAALLGVLAELLDFVAASHAEGLLLGALSPHDVWIDGADRVHYLGSELARATSPFSPPYQGGEREGWTADSLAYLFPPQRYPRGFSAPEVYVQGSVPDQRSDLFAWGIVAYFLLTGEHPEELARQQGRSWVRFGDEHLKRLEKALRPIPPACLRAWAEQLEIDGESLVRNWPGNLVDVCKYLLSPKREQRPSCVAQLRTWLQAPPPPPVAALVALRREDGRARLFLERGPEAAGLEVVICRGAGQPPLNPSEGTLVADGAIGRVVEDPTVPRDQEIHYAAFSRGQGSMNPFSVPTTAPLIEGTPENLRRLVEEELVWTAPPPSPPYQGGDRGGEPALVTLLFPAVDVVFLAETFLGSAEASLRQWAVQHLAGLLPESRPASAEALLWRALRDPVVDVRWQAVQTLLPNADAERLRRLIILLGGDDPQERWRVAGRLRQEGVSESLVRQVVADLEAEQATVCPFCRQEVVGPQRQRHLFTAHDYLEVQGNLLPRPLALERLWERVCTQGDVQAHQQLVELLLITGQAAYLAALEEELDRRTASVNAGPGADTVEGKAPLVVERIAHCLGQEPAAADLVLPLLRSAHRRVREVARLVLLPHIRRLLLGIEVSAAQVRQQLESECPGDDLLEERILLCMRLAQAGVDQAAVNACLAQLQEQRPFVCTECGCLVPLVDLETHLRRSHRIFEFRGVRRSAPATRSVLLRTLCSSTPDLGAWKTLVALAHDEIPEHADRRIVSWLCQKLRSMHREERTAAVGTLAEAMVAAGDGPRFLPLLTSPLKEETWQPAARLLALEVVQRLQPPLPMEQVEAMHPFLADKRLPQGTRQKAVAALLQTTGTRGMAAKTLLRSYLSNSGKLRAIAKLQQLEPLVGQGPAIENLILELENQVRMTCPRCATQLPREKMVPHLWEEHRLMLYGQRVREPWRVLEDWVEDYRLEKDAAHLHRCRDLAQKLEGQDGLHRLGQMMLRRGLEDPETLAALKINAWQEHASLCPHCFGLVPLPKPRWPAPLTLSKRRLSGHGYQLLVMEKGLAPWLVIQQGEEVLFSGRQPGRRLTRKGTWYLLVGPLIFLMAIVLHGVVDLGQPPGIIMLLAVGLGLLLSGLLFLLWPAPPSSRRQLVHLAWSVLVPKLLEKDLTRGAADFLAGLAQVSLAHGNSAQRQATVRESLALVAQLAENDESFLPHVAALARLAVTDLLRQGEDPVPFLVAELAQALIGRLPLRLAGLLLPGLFTLGEESTFWKRGQKVRLQALLCGQAFAASLGPAELLRLCRAEPELLAVIPQKFELLAAWRLLWKLAEQRPWERCGAAATVFELARQPGNAKVLGRFPELLLAVHDQDITLCAGGVFFQQTCFSQWPHSLEVCPRGSSKNKGFDLVMGTERFWYADDPAPLMKHLEGWFRYYFRELCSQLSGVHAWGSPMAWDEVKKKNQVSCLECRRPLMPCLGDVGLPVE